MTTEDILLEADAKMKRAGEALRRELAAVRTGRASPALLEHLRIDYHGVPTPLGQVAGITVPEARQLLIQPWDQQAIPAIEKAIHKSDLGLTPSSDGRVIRLTIPQLTEERRQQLVKVVRKRVEEGRISVRNIRREAAEGFRELKAAKEISEDDQKRAMDQLQKLTDSFIEQIDGIGRDKEAELLEV